MTTTVPDFVHLHVHTQYSLLDGAIRIDSLFQRALDFGMDSVAITDHGTMFGVLEFYQKAKEFGIKPVIGCECYVAPRTRFDKTPMDSKGLTHLVLLASNMEGYKNLCRLASAAQIEGFYYKPRIDKDILKECSKGLICLSACLHGEIPGLILENRIDAADQAALMYQQIFGEGSFYLEVQNNGIDKQEKVNKALLDMSKRLSIPLVASNDCHYLAKEDVRAHDVLLCIQTGKTVQDNDRLKFSTDQLYFKSKQEMCESFKDYPGAIDNTVDIAKRCNIEFDFSTYHFPEFDTGPGQTADELFEQNVRTGFDRVIGRIKKRKSGVDEKAYKDRLEYEISVIKDMGFSGYFLIVADFILFAKENGVPVGPGRGSVAGSLVAFCLKITDIDPIEHGLIFERFLNPARKSMPDIDVDFCINGREKVFNYVVDKYGGAVKGVDSHVAQIITYGKLKTRAVIRDVGRALDIPLREVDAIAKMVPDVLNITLDEAIKQEPGFNELAETKPEVADLLNVCRVLEGLPRHASVHAAGVVISDKPLVEYLPLYKGKKDEIVTQFDMKYVEKIGLVKFDFLGLRNLTVIANTLSLISGQGKEPPDLGDLDLSDPETYKLLASGETTGVFQLESSGMRDLIMRLRPESFDEIIALVALYRPGPMESGMIDDFVKRKHGLESIEYMAPGLEPVLKETYGVIVYQEQVMKIAGTLASYSMSEADDLRKAMGKKMTKIMDAHRDRFIKGGVSNNLTKETAAKLFDLIEKFGGYGFNKSHSAAYALIAFQTAFLKAHFPVEFMAALLSSEMHSIDGVVKYIAECKSSGISVLPPDINDSDMEFAVKGSEIRFGLVAVKNVGEAAIESISEVRKDGRFSSLYDFCERVGLRKVNKRVIESLIKCGAFDFTGNNRSEMMESLEEAIDYGQRVQREKTDPQMGLFDMQEEIKNINCPKMHEKEEWPEKQLLAFEKEALGFYITGHPLGRYEEIFCKFTDADTITLKDKKDGASVRIGGIVIKTKPFKTKKGDMMAFITLEDMHGTVEVIVFSSLYAKVYDLLADDRPVIIQGHLQKDERSVKILADEIISVDRAEEIWTASIHINLETDRIDKKILLQLRDMLDGHPGTCKTYLHLRNKGKTETIIALSDSMHIKAGALLNQNAKKILGYDAVETLCKPVIEPAEHNKYKKTYNKRKF